ncbi:MAG: glucose-1-phosphate adenylyltransferase [Bifidobacteriaceae bacterium]|jgi:glucose-1-phosphate adenylyltransferase|nr:glucose-1-phosphate adenylyltransferase [Bifidobacteriaceae bacterium]
MSNTNPKVLSIILAGGEGKRMMPLTRDRAKPAVPFGGVYRLIDFPISNLVNSGLLSIIVLSQYKSHSLNKHISQTWQLNSALKDFITPVPAQQRTGSNWYMGSADAIYQCMHIIEDEQPDIIIVVGADHVYRMDFSQLVESHIASGAEFSVAGIRQRIDLASEFGVIEIDPNNPTRIERFVEKPENPRAVPDNPGEALCSMGNYIANTDAFVEFLKLDAQNENSAHDMGGDAVPYFVSRGQAGYYDFSQNQVRGALDRDRGYWRDVGSIDSYYEANMDLISMNPVFNLYNMEWPLINAANHLPPAKFVHGGKDDPNRVGTAVDSIISEGTIISGGSVNKSILSTCVKVHSYARVEESIILNSCVIGQHAVVKRAVLDKNVEIGEGVQIGVDHDRDRERGLHVTESGITVITKGTKILD